MIELNDAKQILYFKPSSTSMTTFSNEIPTLRTEVPIASTSSDKQKSE